MRILLLHPGIASRPCSECKKWVYEKDSATPKEFRGKPLPLRGKPPCMICPKCVGDEKSPKAGKRSELSEKNLLMIESYWESKATGEFVGDHITRECFGLIEQVIQETKITIDRVGIERGGP